LSRTPFVKEVEVLDAELRARFGACAESNAVHEEVVEKGQDLDCEQNQTLRTRRRLWKQRERRPDSEPEPANLQPKRSPRPSQNLIGKGVGQK
jgi:hypothetical protein